MSNSLLPIKCDKPLRVLGIDRVHVCDPCRIDKCKHTRENSRW